jgi:hypothetical protein
MGPTIPFPQALLLYILLVWMVIWKGIALWRAAHANQRNWFLIILVSMLIINTFGLLEIIYLFRFAKKRMTIKDIKNWFTKTFTVRSR